MDILQQLYNRFYDTLTDMVLWVTGDIQANPQKIVLWGAILAAVILKPTVWYLKYQLRNAYGMGAFDAYREAATNGRFQFLPSGCVFLAAIIVLAVIILTAAVTVALQGGY